MIAETPVQRPSSPSIRLKELVTTTIQTVVISHESQGVKYQTRAA